MIRAKAIPALAALLAMSPALALGNRSVHFSSSSEPDTVICTVLEVHANTQSGATIAIVHQKNKTDQTKFASLLAHADGGAVQIQVEQGPWVAASILRLRSCFGRGLLMFPTANLKIADQDTVNVKFSAPRLTAERVPDAPN